MVNFRQIQIFVYKYTYKIQDISRCFEKISTNGGVTRAQYENMFAKYLGSQVKKYLGSQVKNKYLGSQVK